MNTLVYFVSVIKQVPVHTITMGQVALNFRKYKQYTRNVLNFKDLERSHKGFNQMA